MQYVAQEEQECFHKINAEKAEAEHVLHSAHVHSAFVAESLGSEVSAYRTSEEALCRERDRVSHEMHCLGLQASRFDEILQADRFDMMEESEVASLRSEVSEQRGFVHEHVKSYEAMNKSLRDQLLTAGLAADKPANSVRKKKQKQIKKPKNQRGATPEITRQVEQAQRDKAAQDKELNRLRQLEVEKKAQLAQIRQLIDTSKIDRAECDVAYHYVMDGKVRSIHVASEQQKQLARNQIAIVIYAGDHVELVPRVVAEKIARRDASRVIENTGEQPDTPVEDDPYADYQIPDDLIW